MNNMPAVRGDRVLTELDHVRLARCLARAPGRSAGRSPGHDDPAADPDLPELLSAAQVVPGREVPAHVVTMYTSVLVQDHPTAAPRKLTLCYPQDAEPAQGFVSVLSPVGSALLGLPVGATARWRLPDGRWAEARLLEILFQPEASGDYTL